MVKRYNVINGHLTESPSGEWVRYEDYLELSKKLRPKSDQYLTEVYASEASLLRQLGWNSDQPLIRRSGV